MEDSKTDLQFKIIDNKLDAIKEQTTKTNGRVTKLEDKVHRLEIQVSSNSSSSRRFNEVFFKVLTVFIGAGAMYLITNIR